MDELQDMPITYNNLYHQIISFENLYLAYLDAATGRKIKPEVLEFSDHAEEKIMRIHRQLATRSWKPGKYRQFLSHQEVKRRVIDAPDFADRVVHMAIYRVLSPLFDSKFIYDSYACRAGKGSTKAVARVRDFLRRAKRQYEKVYVLQCDIAKFYPSIYKPYLMEKMARTIRDKDVLELLETIYYDFNGEERGVPIGAATSQLAANVVLDTLDHFCKECMMVKYYVRYMDDVIILGDSKDLLHNYLRDIEWLVSGVLKLRLNPKTRIYPASRGVDFAGYRTWATHIKPRKRNVKAAKIRFKDLSWKYKHGKVTLDDVKPRVVSFLGYMSHCNGYKTTVSTLNWLKLQRDSSRREETNNNGN